jgi:molybdate transport system regulatory protein
MVANHGALTKAAAALGMSYRYAWLLLEDLNRSFTEPVTSATVGGARGGGVKLTRFGADVVRRYHLASRGIDAAARRSLGPLLRKAARRPRVPAGSRSRSIKRAA